jgi:hypothetical protein
MTDAKPGGGGVAYRLGWVLYWACLARDGQIRASLWFSIGRLVIPSLLIYGLGRLIRWVLSGE